jgi:hypothetical protein
MFVAAAHAGVLPQTQDYVDQLKLIIKVLGPPSEDDLSFINSSKARAYIRALPQQEVRSSPVRQQLACARARRRAGAAAAVLRDCEHAAASAVSEGKACAGPVFAFVCSVSAPHPTSSAAAAYLQLLLPL